MTSLKDRTVRAATSPARRTPQLMGAVMITRKISPPEGAVTPAVGFVPAIYVPRRADRNAALRHKKSADWQGDFAPGADPDGSTWIVQERRHR
jgi:hypothetical protein